MEEVNIVILGAGVAGLFAAYELVERNFNGTIAILEQGASMQERLSSDNARQDIFRGVGGPGLFSDGKICLSEKAGTRLTDFIDSNLLQGYATRVSKILERFLLDDNLLSTDIDENAIKPIKGKLEAVGLEMQLSYPVIHLGSDRVQKLALELETFLKAHGVHLLTGSTAEEIEKHGDVLEIRYRDKARKKTIKCQYLIAAVGKSGHEWLCKQLVKWDIRMEANIPDIGIRLEFPNTITQELLSIVQNPRIVMRLNDTYIKTHCWCYGGHISTYEYQGATLVDGETFKNSLTQNTSVNLLYHYTDGPFHDAVKNARAFLQEAFLIAQGKPLMQRLGDMREDKQPLQPSIDDTTSETFQIACLERIFPRTIKEGFFEFVKRMDAIWPGVADGSTVVYAPVVEWDTYRLQVNENMLTAISNVYAVGDGAGLSQGVVTAATCGLIAAKHIAETTSNKETFKQFVEEKAAVTA